MGSGDPLRRIASLILAMAGCFAVFAVWPGIDLAVTATFYRPGTGFAAFDTGIANAVRMAIWRLSEAVLAVALAAVAVGAVTHAPVLAVPRRLWAYICLLFLLAPGLGVDVLVKRIWGRARPADTVEFGGTLLFTPPHQIAHQCARNCSFVSGEVAGAVALAVALGLILHHLRDALSPRATRTGRIAILLLPLYTGFQRIAAGRHFLSDAIFAALFVLLIACGLYLALFARRKT